tara:strand:- start:638 stop:889 length:252 start_codon:yes stop_codon:yes gene_type:complete
LPALLAVVGGVGILGGVTVAVIGREVIQDNDTIEDKIESSLIKIGFTSEGIVKGMVISVPVCAIALIVVNMSLKAQKKLVGGL